MANTYSAIATVTVGSGGASSIDFTSIPGSYTDLLIKVSSRINNSMTSINCYFNSDTTNANYTDRRLRGNGSTATSDTSASSRVYIADGTDATANTFDNAEIYIPNYRSANYKSFSADGVAENNATLGYVGLNAVVWNNTAAITSISLYANTNNFVQYSTATLYGIKNS